MVKDSIRIAVIGCGYWGSNLSRVLFQLGVLDTICDLDSNLIARLKNKYPRVKFTSNYLEVASDKDIDAVVISTPTQTHFELGKEFLLAGKDVFMEKPLALNLADGKELCRLAERNGRILMVGHILEYHPAILVLKKLIETGKLGKIQYIYSNRLNLGRIRKEEDILWSFAPHDISVMLFILGRMPLSVSVSGGNYVNHKIADVTVSSLAFPNDIKGHIFVSWLHPFKEQKLIIVGNRRMVLFDNSCGKGKLHIFNHTIKNKGDLSFLKKKEAEQVFIADKREPLLLECAHLIRCLKTRRIPRTSGNRALKVLEVLEACEKSLLEHRSVFISRNNSINSRFFIAPSSIVEPGVMIGSGTKIWHFSHVMKGAKLGRNCNIGQNVFIGSGAILGERVKVQNNVSVYEGVQMQNDVFCGPSVVFTNVKNPRAEISRKNEYLDTIIKKGATLGANSTIICGNSVGEYAFVGAGSVITKEVPNHALVYGNPAKLKGWVCRCGCILKFRKESLFCPICHNRYKISKGKVLFIETST